jgi:peptide-methionine (R)-S-oxide reductase
MKADMTRRWLILAPFAAGGAVLLWRTPGVTLEDGSTPGDTDTQITVVEFSDSGESRGPARVTRLIHSEDEWFRLLTPQQFYVTRRQHTDPPFSGSMYRAHDAGLFRCICCANALFSSQDKYDSGTGWPSFRKPIAKQNIRYADSRIPLASGVEVSCRRCDAHLGHVFDDGPAPAHLRYCINESSLKFV